MEVEEGRVEWKGKVEKWREALREVAGLQGMVLQEECDGTSAEGNKSEGAWVSPDFTGLVEGRDVEKAKAGAFAEAFERHAKRRRMEVKKERWCEKERWKSGEKLSEKLQDCRKWFCEGKCGMGTETDKGVVNESASHVNSPKRPYSQEFEDNSILPHQSNWKRQFMGIFSLLPSLPKFFFLQNKRCS
nr:TMV resistance protein N-like isoform X2 [Ipomoea batatas]